MSRLDSANTRTHNLWRLPDTGKRSHGCSWLVGRELLPPLLCFNILTMLSSISLSNIPPKRALSRTWPLLTALRGTRLACGGTASASTPGLSSVACWAVPIGTHLLHWPDVSMWFYHARRRREGENAGLRLMFFRLAKLLSDPILPLFVFDGPKRPAWKRGTRVSKRPHWMVHGMKIMIGAFGFEWREVCSMTLTPGLDCELRC
jgi:hypothetical protein